MRAKKQEMQAQAEKSFVRVLEDNKGKIHRICQVYAKTPVEPNDLFQEVVFHIWKSFSTFQNKPSINTWVYKIALNVCMRSKMKLENKNTVKLEAIHFESIRTQPCEVQNEKIKALHLCVSALNENKKPLVILYLEELSYKEIAEIIGLTENHIAVKMKRIRKKLLDCITHKLQ